MYHRIASYLCRVFLLLAGIGTLLPSAAGAQTRKQPEKSVGNLAVVIVNKETSEPVAQAAVMVMPYGVWGVTNDRGKAEIRNIPAGRCTVQVSILGYISRSEEYRIEAGGTHSLTLPLEPLSLAIDDVVVVAQAGKSGESTASVIGRQAIDHIQATSLKDIMQLLPGQIVTENPSLTAVGQFHNRTLDRYDNNNAFGAAILVDGVPLSNNANLNSRGGSFSTVGSGVDLRSIGTDEIESVEIIRGIASAEYGDVSSGTMIVNSKVGVTDFKVRSKIMPGIQQFYAGKGFNLKGGGGSLNVNADYAVGKSDPRYRTDTYNRLLLSAIHRITFGGRYTLTSKISASGIRDWSGPDKDEKVQDVFSRTRERGFTLSHAGVFNFDRLFCRTFKYDLSYSYKASDSYTRALVQGRQPLLDAREEGTYTTTLLPLEYRASGGTKGRPATLFVKLSDGFHLDTRDGLFRNRFNIGAEYRAESNSGIGVYNDDPSLPLTQTGTRPRAFADIPALHQLAAYAEDNIALHFRREQEFPRLKVQAGVRWTMIQPGSPERMQSLSPRLNTTLHPVEWLGLRFGVGISEKTPSLAMLYPDKSYFDFMNLNYSFSGEYLGVYTTRVFDHTPRTLRPMRSTKLEAGVDIETRRGQRFSIVAFRDKVRNGFSQDNGEWVSLIFDRWLSSDVSTDSERLTYDPEHPSQVDTLLHNVTRPGNRDVHISRGIEWDFNLGKIRATNTSFYLTGAYTQTEYYSSNLVYNRPQGSAAAYEKTYVVYTNSSRSTLRQQLTSSLRIVQSIPRLKFVVSGTVQAVLYDYTRSNRALDAPIGYLSPARGGYAAGRAETVFTPFTQADLSAPEGVTFGDGHKLSDQLFARSAYQDKAETWPSLWVVNLRVTKDVTRFLGLSFYVNNLFFSQPWHKSSISTSESERNSNLFSYGFEVYFNF